MPRGKWLIRLFTYCWTDDGLCAIDINVGWEPPQVQDVSTYREISLAAASLIDACVKNPVRNIGGAAWNLGVSHARHLPLEGQDFATQIFPSILSISLSVAFSCPRFRSIPTKLLPAALSTRQCLSRY